MIYMGNNTKISDSVLNVGHKITPLIIIENI